ncbi:hypothetical protein [Nostoc sp. PA-18-2419]|uniref:hypothetical protein n=1 Tax=Nostoc sp. PA-18-2419 TaxID=2575443 RepID=UPI001109F083|nr:hypothetical protein [Nostoc sp. PA-18-2419]
MARKARKDDLQPGKFVHYWGRNWQVHSIDDHEVTLVTYGHLPNTLYQPFHTGMLQSTSTKVNIDSPFLLIFGEDDKKHPWEK